MQYKRYNGVIYNVISQFFLIWMVFEADSTTERKIQIAVTLVIFRSKQVLFSLSQLICLCLSISLILTYVAATHDGNIIANIHVDFCYFTIFKDYMTGLEVLAGYYTICSKVAS